MILRIQLLRSQGECTIEWKTTPLPSNKAESVDLQSLSAFTFTGGLVRGLLLQPSPPTVDMLLSLIPDSRVAIWYHSGFWVTLPLCLTCVDSRSVKVYNHQDVPDESYMELSRIMNMDVASQRCTLSWGEMSCVRWLMRARVCGCVWPSCEGVLGME